MRDFLGSLERELTQLAAARPAERIRTPRWRQGLAGVAAGLVAVAGSFAVAGTSAAELPILTTPTTDATALRDSVPDAARLGVDFARAHAFGTPNGPGYVLRSRGGGAVCLVVPEVRGEGHGIECVPTIEQAERVGIATALIGSGFGARSLVVQLLPDGARDVTLTADGQTRRPAVRSGVVAEAVDGGGTLRWTVDGRTGSTAIPAPFRDDALTFSCSDGRQLTIDPATLGARAADARVALDRARRRACAR